MLRLATFLIILTLPSLALADKAQGEACAARLLPDAKQIYEVVAPKVTRTSNNRRIAAREARLLVRAGKIDSAKMADSILQARPCLRLVRMVK